VFEADTPRVTASGVHYTVPAGWTLTTSDRIAIVSAPEGDLSVAIVETGSQPLDAAMAEAWRRYGHTPPARHRVVDGVRSGSWARTPRAHAYELSPVEKRVVVAEMRWHDHGAVVVLVDASDATRQRRSSQFALLDASIQPPGQARARFAGTTVSSLRGERIAKLEAFIERSLGALSIPGAAVAVAQGDEVVLERGYGVRELGKPERVDTQTLFRIGSVTKPLTSLLLARLVDAGVLRWEQPVVEVYPDFKLGDPATTASTHIEHLLCACTGLPRSDLPRLFEFANATPQLTMRRLSQLQPTTRFGEAFQYSNELAAAAGFVAGHALDPKLPLGESYERAMQRWIFQPLEMRSTTFDYSKALHEDHAAAHTWSIRGRGATEVIAPLGLDGATRAIVPAGFAWSNADDMLRYVQLELTNGVARDGRRVVSESSLRKRRERYARTAERAHYGIGLEVGQHEGATVVGHEGYVFGYYSKVFWLPELEVGAVLLANADAASMLGEALETFVLESLFDAAPTAETHMRERGALMRRQLSDMLAAITIPAAPDASAALATHYDNSELGSLDVERSASATTFDFGEWKSDVASRIHEDRSVSFMTITPGFDIFEFTAGTTEDGKRRLTVRDAQHEYAFVETR
jgi:CubicO group peptidase (beta-lactamase class C family)